jgi:RimJ/RimL family protein N-acetyltransferase
MKTRYLFTSKRLGFRTWKATDLTAFAALNADAQVMRYFPNTRTKSETKALLSRLQTHFNTHGFTYFATEILETGEFIGFIGLAHQTYAAPFNPAVDIGWRLKQDVWKNGYATEGAKQCLSYAFTTLNLESIIAVCTQNNIPSQRVMQKIGMQKMGVFNHPALLDYPHLKTCLWYQITNPNR